MSLPRPRLPPSNRTFQMATIDDPVPAPGGCYGRTLTDLRAPAALREWAAREAGRPFIWGDTDCATLARRGVAAFLGSDPAPELAPWRSLREARERIDELPRILTALGWERLRLSFAEPGDLLLQAGEEAGLPSFGIVLGGSYLTSTVEEGVVRRPLSVTYGPVRLLRPA